MGVFRHSAGSVVAFGSATTITFSGGEATVSGGDNGAMTLYLVESATIEVTEDPGGAGEVATSVSLDVDVTAGSGSEIVFTSPTRTISSGEESSNLELELRDDWGNQAMSSGTTTLELSDAPDGLTFLDTDGAELSPAGQLTIADQGSTAAFRVTGTTADTYTITVEDAAAGLTSASQSFEITITGSDAGTSLVDASPGTQTVGEDITVTVTVRDSGNNLLENEDVAVYVADGDLVGTGTSDASGEVAVTYSQQTPGSVEFVAYLGNDDQGTEITERATVEFEAGSVDRFVLLTTDGDPIGDQVAGETFEVQVQAVDELGNVVPGYDGEKTVQFSGGDTAPDGESDPDYPETITFTDGVASPVEITLYLAETDVELTLEEGSISGTGDPFDVLANEILTMRLEGPENLVAGEVSDVFTLTILDAYENTAPVTEDTEFNLTSTGTVFYLDAEGENEITTYTVTDGGGTGEFYYSTAEAGKHTITATWGSGEPLLDGQSASFEIQVGSGTPDRLEIVTQPEVDVEGEPLTVQPVIYLLDEHGNRIETDNTTEVLVEIGEGEDGELGGTTKITFKEGVGTFENLVLNGKPLTDYKLRFRTDPEHGMDPVLSDPLSMASVGAGVPASLVKVSGDDQSQPTRSELEQSITVRVLDRDEEPLPDAEVQFRFNDVPDGAVDYEVVDSLLVSDDEGLVRARIRLGSEPGDYTVEASAHEGDAETVSFGATATFTAPNPSFVDTVNTVVFSGGLSSYMYADYDESIDQTAGLNFETWVLPNSLESDGVIASRWNDESPSEQQYQIRVVGNTVTVRLVDENGHEYEMEIPNFFRDDGEELAGMSLLEEGAEDDSSGVSPAEEESDYSWTHISLVVDPENEWIQLYRDGFEVKRAQLYAPLQTSTARMDVGRGFDGEIHEIRLWDRPRSRSEIQALKDLILTGTEENLVLYHTFDDEMNEEMAADLTDLENHFYFGEEVDRRFSLRNVTLVTLHQDEDFIVRLAALDQTGGSISAQVIELPQNGTLYQLGDELARGDEVSSGGTRISESFNRSLYVPDPNFAGMDSIRYRITDQYGNFTDSVMKFEVLAVNRPPAVFMIGQPSEESNVGRIEFNQRDSLRIGLDTLVVDNMYSVEEIDWQLEILDERRERVCLAVDGGGSTPCATSGEESGNLSLATANDSASTSDAGLISGAERVLLESGTLEEEDTRFDVTRSEDGTIQEIRLQEVEEYLVVRFDQVSRELTFTSTPRFADENYHFRLEAYDPEGLSGRRDFLVTVHQVNDPPSEFELLVPANQDTIPVNQLRFHWETSMNLDEDPIEYSLHLRRDDGELYEVEALSDTLYTFEELPAMLLPERSYTWWVTASDGKEVTESRERWIFETSEEMPLIYELRQNYPNPFRGETTIEYWIPVASEVKIELYDLLGRRVRVLLDEPSVEAGIYRSRFQSRDLASGVYFYRIAARGVNGSRFMKVKQLTLIR